MRTFLNFLAAGTALTVTATLASAATVTLGISGFTPGPLLLADSTTGTVLQNVTGTIGGLRKDPWAATAFAGTGLYTAVTRDASATYSFGATTDDYSFLWGTPDAYNTLELLLGGVVVDSVAGDETGIADFADQATNRFVTVSSTSLFDGVRFNSSGISFEYASIEIAPVPLPAAGGLLLLAMGGIAALKRRKA